MAKQSYLQMVATYALCCIICARTTGGVRREELVHDHVSVVRSNLYASRTSKRSWDNSHSGILAANPSGDVGTQQSNSLQAAPLGGGEVHVSFYSYPASGLFVACIVTFLYGGRGWVAVCSILAYLFSNSMMKLTMKWVFETNNFKFPFFVTALHFAAGTLASLMVLLLRKKPFHLATCREFFFMAIPIGVTIVTCVGAGNLSLVLCSAAFTEVIGSSTCLITVAIVILSGLPFNHSQIFPAFLVAVGCAISSIGEMHFSLVGLIMCFLANIARSVKVTLQQKTMTGEVKEKYDPCALLFWTCMPATVLMTVCSMASEGLAPWHRAKAVMSEGATSEGPSAFMRLCVAVLSSCLNATILNLAQLWVTRDLGAVGSQIIVQSKTILTVLGGMALFGEPVTWLEGVGFITVFLGVFLFSYAERVAKDRFELERFAEEQKRRSSARDPM
mmetsp:Transcript_69961/g.138589  ORF Transcript_69961/g.138589 Transcript_69961/m.138589 type:complete len:446 (+) Transcript_69961:78-1415(+)